MIHSLSNFCLHSAYSILSIDLATQMQHLTGLDATDSPQFKRSSRVLSWISESEDLLFEDTGDGLHFKGLDNTESDESKLLMIDRLAI